MAVTRWANAVAGAGMAGDEGLRGTAVPVLCRFPARTVTTAIKSFAGFRKLLLLWRRARAAVKT